MKTLSALAVRAKRVAVLGLVLVGIGAGAATAYWTASDEVHGSAGAASVGITQTKPLKLEKTYNAGALIAADAVTITNTGEREASVKSTVSAADGQTLSSALVMRVAEVASAEACTPGAGLTGAVMGGTGLSYVPLKKLPAGQSIIVCVQTFLTPQKLFSLPSGSAKVSVTSTLTFAQGAKWKLSETADVSQHLATDRASGAPVATCTGDSTWRNYDELTFGLKRDFASGATDVRAFIVQDGQISELAGSAITVNRAARTVIISEETLRAHRKGLGHAQVVITQGEVTGIRTVAGLGRIEFTSALNLDWITHASCR